MVFQASASAGRVVDSFGGFTKVGCGKSASLLGKVIGSFALGFTSPKRTLATASAPRLPGYHASRMPATWPAHGIVTGLPVSSTTIVYGFAAATLAIKSS